MYLYNLTLQKGSAIQTAVYGNFTDSKAQEIVVSRGKVLDLLRPADTISGEGSALQVVCSMEVFGQIRSLQPFRLPGAPTDHLIVGSDSGRIVILGWNKERNIWKKIHQETYGRTGCRRTVPGQFLATDPRGRACMIGALEKHKLVYVLNRDASANLVISSPLEAHKGSHLCFGIAGLDMGYDNPVFASLELDYSEIDEDATGEAAQEAQKLLVYYELDLGLNTVKRAVEEPIDNGANLLIPVPGGADGPGGLLVCAENFLYYVRLKSQAELAATGAQGAHQVTLQAVIPRRTDLSPERSVLITSFTSFRSKRTGLFFLLQSEYGDLYKVTLTHDAASNAVLDLTIKYFDTLPPCASISILKSGFLFAASEFGNHGFYQIQAMGDGDAVEVSASACQPTEEGGFAPVFFDPRPLENLALVDETSSLSPIIDLRVENATGEESPQIYALCGRGARSSLRVLRPGIAINEMISVDLPERPQAIFTLRRSVRDTTDSLMIVSYANSTIVLAVQEGNVTQVMDSAGLLSDQATLRVQLMNDDSIVQVTPKNVRHVLRDKRTVDWDAPARKPVDKASSNDTQLVIALRGGELLYFELDKMTQKLRLVTQKDMNTDVASLDVAPVPLGRTRAPFLAVGAHDSTVKIYSLEHETCLQICGMQHTEAAYPHSLLFMDSEATSMPGLDQAAASASASGAGPLFLQMGLSNGVLMRVQVDRVSGQLSDSRWRFLGLTPPKLVPVIVKGRRAMVALSKRPWLGYVDMGRYLLSPLSYDALDFVAPFSSEEIPEGFVAVGGPKAGTSQAGMRGTLRFISAERLGEAFSQASTALRYTPRKMAVVPEWRRVVVCESDHQTLSLARRARLAAEAEGLLQDGVEPPSVPGPELDPEAAAREAQFGAPKGEPGTWASCVRLVDPVSLGTLDVLELDEDEAALSMCTVSFGEGVGRELGRVVAVGTAKKLQLAPRKSEGGAIRIYRLSGDGGKLELVHKTDIEGVPGALSEFHGRLMAGVDNVLRLYDCGRKKVLRKCEYRKLPNPIVSLQSQGKRVYVGDVQESVFFLKYRPKENDFYMFADDASPRFVTSTCLLDYDTIATADKFGNVAVLRLPSDASTRVENDPSGGKALVKSEGAGAAFKLQSECNFHVGEVVTALQRATLQPGGTEVLLYSTIGGSLGALYPIGFKEDVDFFQHFEMHMRQEAPPLLGRDHMSYRSYYFPVRSVIDGDLCEQYPALRREVQEGIADGLDKTPGEVLKKLEEIRSKTY